MRMRSYVAYGPETWVPAAQYEKAMASSQEIKQKNLEVYSEGKEMIDDKRSLIVPCWPLEDIGEG